MDNYGVDPVSISIHRSLPASVCGAGAEVPEPAHQEGGPEGMCPPVCLGPLSPRHGQL